MFYAFLMSIFIAHFRGNVCIVLIHRCLRLHLVFGVFPREDIFVSENASLRTSLKIEKKAVCALCLQCVDGLFLASYHAGVPVGFGLPWSAAPFTGVKVSGRYGA